MGYRWVLGGAVAGTFLALLTATALAYTADNSTEPAADPVVSLLWQVRVGQLATGPPGVTADGVVLGGLDGKIRAYALADGRPEWTFHATSGNPVYTRAVDGAVYAATGGGEVFAVDAETGRERWRAKAATAFDDPPAVGEDRVFLSGADDALHAYRIDDGGKDWRVRTGGEIRAGPTVVGEVAVVASDDGRLYLVSGGGSVRRTRAVGLAVGAPISTGDAACVPMADGSVHCVRTADGKSLARITQGGTKLSAPARGDGAVLAAAADGSVVAWDMEAGTQKWVFKPAKPAIAPGHLVVGAGRVVVAYPDGRLAGIDATSGQGQWEITLPDNFDEGARLDRTAMYIVGRSGTLYALQAPAARD